MWAQAEGDPILGLQVTWQPRQPPEQEAYAEGSAEPAREDDQWHHHPAEAGRHGAGKAAGSFHRGDGGRQGCVCAGQRDWYRSLSPGHRGQGAGPGSGGLPWTAGQISTGKKMLQI